MAFDFSGEFNRLYSTDATDMLGAVHQIEQQKERRLAGAALSNLAKIKQAEVMKEKGYYAAPQMMQQQQKSPGIGERLLGAITPALGQAASYGIGRLFNSGSSGSSSSGLNLDAVQSYMTPSNPYSIPSSSVPSSSGLNLNGVSSYMSNPNPYGY